MNLLPLARQTIIQQLWESYLQTVPLAKHITTLLLKFNQQKCILDHLAIIDLPGPHSGIPFLSKIFTSLGFETQGAGYLPDKQNDFSWLAECDAKGRTAAQVMPQIVVADFRLHELPMTVRTILEKYIKHIPLYPSTDYEQLCQQIAVGDPTALTQVIAQLEQMCSGRAWPTPTLHDFNAVREANELLAWTLVFGRRPNHFGISIHLMSHFNNLNEFNEFVKKQLGIALNQRDGEIKGNTAMGITQSSTADDLITMQLEDASLQLPAPFLEFVWRYPVTSNTNATLWDDFFVGFYAQNANTVIESVYV